MRRRAWSSPRGTARCTRSGPRLPTWAGACGSRSTGRWRTRANWSSTTPTGSSSTPDSWPPTPAGALLDGGQRWVGEPLGAWLEGERVHGRCYEYVVPGPRPGGPRGGTNGVIATGMPPPAILHMDMDAFFVAVEVHRDPEPARDAPSWWAAPGAGAWWPPRATRPGPTASTRPCPRGGPDGCAPMPCSSPGHHERYGEVSARVMAILASFTPLVEPLSLDEAFLDVTGARRLWADRPGDRGRRSGRPVLDQEGLTCSVGVAPTKFLAKLASEAAKPIAALDGVRPGRGVVVVPAGGELALPAPAARPGAVGRRAQDPRAPRPPGRRHGRRPGRPAARHPRGDGRRRQRPSPPRAGATASTTVPSSPGPGRRSRSATRRPSPPTTTTRPAWAGS